MYGGSTYNPNRHPIEQNPETKKGFNGGSTYNNNSAGVKLSEKNELPRGGVAQGETMTALSDAARDKIAQAIGDRTK